MSSDDTPSASDSSAPPSPASPSSPDKTSEHDPSDTEPEPSAECASDTHDSAQSETELAPSPEPSPESSPESGTEAAAPSDIEAESATTAAAAQRSEARSEATNSGSEATNSGSEATNSGSEAPAVSATKKPCQKNTSRTETFDPRHWVSLEHHIENHEYPAHVTTCGPCQFWKNRWQWSSVCSSPNPVTNKKETWLGCQNGFGICLLCAAYRGDKARSALGRGTACLRRFANLKRHAEFPEHQDALQAWQQRLRADAAAPGETVSVFSSAAQATAASATTVASTAEAAADTVALAKSESAASKNLQPGIDSQAVVAARALLETHGSFRSLDVWINALGDEDRSSLESHWRCKRWITTMAFYEKELTRRVLREGAVFRLQADGLERTYQIEIGTVIWSWPAGLKPLQAHGEKQGWLEVLGPRGPWIVERLIGMQEFPQDMDCDGKASMLETNVRRACLNGSGEVDTKLLKHVQAQTRVWCSDGADLQVPLAASAFFPGLVFHAWDEAHSAQRLCANAFNAADDEVKMTDELLVTGRKPYSLAKFLSTSLVFRKTVGDAQVADEIAFVKNFGWAPQRFNSRAKPYARETRRWHTIFAAVATEAAGESKDRRALARMYLGELGGEHSSRLLLGGLLADVSAEHYAWVATGDKKNPDVTTVMRRANEFLARLSTLFDEALILTLPDTFTGVTLKFLEKPSYYRYGRSVQVIGIGDWQKDASASATIKKALGRVQVVVANIREYSRLAGRGQPCFANDFHQVRLLPRCLCYFLYFCHLCDYTILGPQESCVLSPSPPGKSPWPKPLVYEFLQSRALLVARLHSLPLTLTAFWSRRSWISRIFRGGQSQFAKDFSRSKFARRANVPRALAHISPRGQAFPRWLFNARGVGARVSRMARIEKRPQPRGIVSCLENRFWKSGAALSQISRNAMPRACAIARHLSRKYHACGAGPAFENAARVVVGCAQELEA